MLWVVGALVVGMMEAVRLDDRRPTEVGGDVDTSVSNRGMRSAARSDDLAGRAAQPMSDRRGTVCGAIVATLPTGTVTLFFSDIESSTRLLEALGDDYGALLERHHRIMRDAFDRSAAAEAGTEGDSFFAVFPDATDAVASAVAIQRALVAEKWPQAVTLRVRIGLHTGEVRMAGDTYVGLDLHRAARIMDAAHGGQILASERTCGLFDPSRVEGVELRDLGSHRLRDLSGRERLFEVVAGGLPTDFPPLRTLEGTPNNLPTQPSELVARGRELRAIGEQLASPASRLVTLTGPGGIGKTRLALQAAADGSGRFADGVFFVDLSAVRDAGQVLQAIVEAVGVPVARDVDVREALTRELRQRSMLLVLDNFEHVVEAAGELAVLLEQAPKLRILATSREALRIRGEQVLPVEPLGLPDPGDAVSADAIAGVAAVRLLVERARQVRPDFVLTDENAQDVAEISRRLDGLPLAIELAAARLKLFSPAELRARLQSRLELLRGGARDLPSRHRTLRGTIEWSYELLDDEERLVLQLLELFPSARVDAVEQVAAALAPLADVDVVDRLASLVDKSLVRSVEDERGQRLSMLETIREYAAERLRSDPELHRSARQAHAEHYARLATAARGDAGGPGRERAIGELAAELGNLQAAWSSFADESDAAQMSVLLDALWPLYEARGWYQGAIALTNELLAVVSRTTPARERAEDEIALRLSVARGLLALRGYTEEVERLYLEALALAEASGSVPRRQPVLKSLASFYLYRGEIEKTIPVGRQVLELAEENGDVGLQVEGDLILGPALTFVGENEAGMEHLERAIAHFDPDRHPPVALRLGPNPGVAAAAISALLHWLLGHPDTASERAASALELGARLGHPYSRAYAGFHVGLLEFWNGRIDVASERVAEVQRIAEENDYAIWTALGLVLEGVTTARRGLAEEGLARTEQGMALYENLRTPPVFWGQVLGLRADACTSAGRPADALGLLEQAAALVPEGSWESAGVKLQQAEALAALGETGASAEALRAAYDEAGAGGARMLQLKAATALARVEPTDDGLAALRRLLESFAEGLDTPPLLEARAALDEATVGR